MFRSSFTAILAASVVLCRPVWSIGALYSMTNDPSGNSVIINAIGLDGSISYSGSVSTGGKGLHGSDAGAPGPDSLFSQGSVTVAGNHLFVANPGSNSVSMFFINPDDPLDITMVGKPVSTGGEFPVSVTVSPQSGDVCVLNGGAVNGVTCFSVDSRLGMSPRGKFYNFGLNLTTPAAGPGGTVSQVLFSEDGSILRASIKGTPPSPAGFIATWDVASDGSLSSSWTKTEPASGTGLLPFGFSNIPGSPNSILATDPALGATVYNFEGSDPTFSPLTIEGQAATCWSIYAESTGTFFLSDLTANKLYEVTVNSNDPSLTRTYNLVNNTGPTDLAVGTVLGQEYLYALSPYFSSFNVFTLEKGGSKLKQSYNFGNEAKGVALEGINLAGAALYIL